MSVELEASEALLDLGVSIPLRVIRIPFTRKVIMPRLQMKRPCLGSQIRIARLYLQTGVTYEQMKAFTKDEEMEFLAVHGKRVSKMVALTICRGYFSGWLLSPFVAFIIRWFCPDVFIQGANLRFVALLGTKNFMNIIRLTESRNPLKPNLSQKKTGS